MECPKCHHKIGKLDWSQSCRYCGTNLMYYNLEESMKHDAKSTELSFAKTRIFGAKMKATFVGGVLQITRLVMVFACIGLLMIPFCSVKLSTVLCNISYSFNLLEAYNAVSGSTLADINSLTGSEYFGAVAAKAAMMYYGVLAMVAAGVIQLVMLFFTVKNPGKRSLLVAIGSCIGIVSGIFCVINMVMLCTAAQAVDVVSVKTGFGAYAGIVGFAAMLVLNIIITKNGIEIKYKPGDLYRAEISKKIHNGEMTIDELPLPIFETEEEKKERLEELEKAAGESREEVNNG